MQQRQERETVFQENNILRDYDSQESEINTRLDFMNKIDQKIEKLNQF